MQKEKQPQAKPSRDVMVAVAEFTSTVNDVEQISEINDSFDDLFDNFLHSTLADDLDNRKQMLRIRLLISSFDYYLKPFSKKEIEQETTQFLQLEQAKATIKNAGHV